MFTSSQPVYLRVKLVSDAGMINCCGSACPELYCFRVPESYSERRRLLQPTAIENPANDPSLLPACRSCAAAARAASNSSNYLHATPIQHDPYTPDSMDSPSPSAIHPSMTQAQQLQLQPKAVSPSLLKSKLELLEQNRSSSNSEEDDQQLQDAWSPRKSRSNSDVSWQRSHLLTRAWLQGKGQQAYHSFSSTLNRDNGDEPEQLSNVVIPRIAIINASNFESTASSVHLHDDHCSKKTKSSDQYLDTWYTNTRTRSLSEADSPATAATLEENDDDDDVDEKEEVARDEDNTTTKPSIVALANTTTSKNTTRSNSIQSQEANVSLKLKAYNKVTERCKRNIVEKRGRCEKCCVLS